MAKKTIHKANGHKYIKGAATVDFDKKTNIFVNIFIDIKKK